MSEICPKCNSKQGMRNIVYGMPENEPDENEITLGGCCVSENDPTIICTECGWQGGYKNNLLDLL